MPQLSIIVPVYKVENYLQKCVDSILAQTFGDFECLLTDDGSPDRCGEILDAYAQNDSRLIVIHQPNGGVSSARNKGLRLVRGNYVGFVDADDWIEKNMYDSFISVAENGNYDMISCGIMVFNKMGQGCETLSANKVYNDIELKTVCFRKPNPIGGSCCNKIFRRCLISDMNFNTELTIGEDRLFLFEACCRFKKAKAIADCLYYNRYNTESATRQSELHLLKIIPTDIIMLRHTRKMGTAITEEAVKSLVDDGIQCIRIIQNTLELSVSEKRNRIIELYRLICKELLSEFFHGNISIGYLMRCILVCISEVGIFPKF